MLRTTLYVGDVEENSTGNQIQEIDNYTYNSHIMRLTTLT